MVAPIVFMSLLALLLVAVRLRRMWRRRGERTMYVTNWPDIEFSEMYGGWNAEAYDAGTGRDRNAGRDPLGAPSRHWARPPSRPR